MKRLVSLVVETSKSCKYFVCLVVVVQTELVSAVVSLHFVSLWEAQTLGEFDFVVRHSSLCGLAICKCSFHPATPVLLNG